MTARSLRSEGLAAPLILAFALSLLGPPLFAGEPSVKHSVAAPEPQGYWSGPINSPVPVTIAGGKVIHDAHELQALIKRGGTVVVDVSNAPRRPDNMAPGAPWLPLPHPAIPGSLWIPGVGLGEIPSTVDAFFGERLASATGGDLTRRVVIYCHETCWLSWNAARRAIHYGYRNVYWFRDGIEGWRAAGLATAVVKPEVEPLPPSGTQPQPATPSDASAGH
jgi:PQQ-dependent catabolism-associated CXXCW motif protein